MTLEEKKNTMEISEFKCMTCSTAITKGEYDTFGVCDACYEANYKKQTEASGSVAAPKVEPMIIQKSIIPFLLGEDSYDGYWWDQKPIDKRPPFWWRTKLREEVEPITNLQVENAALKIELKEREEALKELIPMAKAILNSITNAYDYDEKEAIIEKARKLLSK